MSEIIGQFGRIISYIDGPRSDSGRHHDFMDIISIREDDSRVRAGGAPENLAVIRHMALNPLKQDKAIKAKRKRAGWDNEYLLAVISQ